MSPGPEPSKLALSVYLATDVFIKHPDPSYRILEGTRKKKQIRT